MKTLWIGCSHSAGTYDKDDNHVNKIGLPVKVSRGISVWEDWKIVAMPGFGIIEYLLVLTYLDNNDLLNFDNLIIQLTHEPRFTTFENLGEKLKYKFLHKYIIENNNRRYSPVFIHGSDYTLPVDAFNAVFNKNPASMYQLHKKRFPSGAAKKALLDMVEDICDSVTQNISPLVEVAFQNIIEITERRNINLYTFTWAHSQMCTYQLIENIDYKKYDIFDGKGIYELVSPEYIRKMYHPETLHPSEFGVDEGSKRIIEALNANGFRG